MSHILAEVAALVRRHAPCDHRFAAVAAWLEAEAAGEHLDPVCVLAQNANLLRARVEELLARNPGPGGEPSPGPRIRHTW